MIIIKRLLLLIFSFLSLQLIEGTRRRRLLRVGIRPDPHLAPFTKTSSLYISYTSFLRGFIKSQGIFNRYAPIPSNSTYATFMDTVAADGDIDDKNEMALFMAHALISSKGLVADKTRTGLFKDLTRNYSHRGYFGISGVEDYKRASLDICTDLRLLEAPELISQDESVNWKVSLWNWRRCALKKIRRMKGKSEEAVYQVYKILKGEWDPKSELY